MDTHKRGLRVPPSGAAFVFLLACASVGWARPGASGSDAKALPNPGGAADAPGGRIEASTRSWIGSVQASDTDPGEIFRKQCIVCHGPEGKGDGPASPAFKPPPRNLTDPDYMSGLSDEHLRDVLRGGKGSMPAFSAVLSASDLDAMVRYVRSLSEKGPDTLEARR